MMAVSLLKHRWFKGFCLYTNCPYYSR